MFTKEDISITHKLNRIQQQELFKIEKYNQFLTLTPREVEIVRLLVSGKSSLVIANELFISLHTVGQHRKNINRKLEVNSFPQLFQYALAFDLI